MREGGEGVAKRVKETLRRSDRRGRLNHIGCLSSFSLSHLLLKQRKPSDHQTHWVSYREESERVRENEETGMNGAELKRVPLSPSLPLELKLELKFDMREVLSGKGIILLLLLRTTFSLSPLLLESSGKLPTKIFDIVTCFGCITFPIAE